MAISSTLAALYQYSILIETRVTFDLFPAFPIRSKDHAVPTLGSESRPRTTGFTTERVFVIGILHDCVSGIDECDGISFHAPFIRPHSHGSTTSGLLTSTLSGIQIMPLGAAGYCL